MTTNQPKTLALGAEYDDRLRDALRAVLIEMGAVQTESTWGVGGSQVLETLTVRIGGREVRVEAETYMGISITGDDDLVTIVADRVEKRVRASGT